LANNPFFATLPLYHKILQMKIGFVVSFFDFRNDVRRVIAQVAKQHEVVIFGRPENRDEILRHLPEGLEFRLINERKQSLWNTLWIKIYILFKRIPKSRHNFFLMELFKASLTSDPKVLMKNHTILKWVRRLPKVISYGIKKPSSKGWSTEQQKQIEYREGPVEALPYSAERGKVSVISDLFGALSYSKAPDQVLATYLAMLKPGGVLYTHGSGAKVNGKWLGEWLAKIPGLKVTQNRNDMGGRSFMLEKTDDTVQIPRLTFNSSLGASPPIQRFRPTEPVMVLFTGCISRPSNRCAR
jgi:hypothetical protein